MLVSKLIKTNSFDELSLFIAPFMIGNGKSFYESDELRNINEIERMSLASTKKIGDQILLNYMR